MTSPTCEPCACGVVPAARADKARRPSNALPSGEIPDEGRRLRVRLGLPWRGGMDCSGSRPRRAEERGVVPSLWGAEVTE